MQFTRHAHPVTTVAGQVLKTGQADGPALQALFNGPSALALDATGGLVVADELGLTVRRLANGTVTTLAGDPTATSGNFDGPARERGLYRPRALAYDAQGRLYIASSNIRRLDADGQLRSYAGLHEPGTFDGGHDTAQFVNIRGMAFGPDGALYVADAKTIRRITSP
jgi:sugar lactone lactonase YvrE